MSAPESDHQAEGLVRRSYGLSLVWLLPVLAALIGIWLLYKDLTQGDISATILFSSGDGLVRGKTAVKYSGVSIGLVKDFRLVPKASGLGGSDGVLAEVSFNHSANYLLVQGSKFWVVKPEVSLMGVRGLETLVSGNYIALEPGSGEPQRKFVAVDKPPAYVRGDGLRITLQAPQLASLSRGSPVYYRQLAVGEVEDYRLADNDTRLDIDLVIHREYAHLVHNGSRFWNTSGISIKGDISGIDVEFESLASLIAGGVSFYTPQSAEHSAKAKDGKVFKLYKNFAAANAGILITLNFDRGVNIGAGSTQVFYRGIKVGEVQSVKANSAIDGMKIQVMMDPATDVLLSENTRFWLAAPSIDFAAGLKSFLEGDHIEVDLRRGQRSVREFDAKTEAPPFDPRVPGLKLRLVAPSGGSIQRDASVYYRSIEVGRVQGMALNSDGSKVSVYVVIDPPYMHLVNSHSRFWNVSGLRVSADLSGIKLQTDSLLSLVRGGIAFGSGPRATKTAQPSNQGDSFTLYPNREAALEEAVDITIVLTGKEGLKPGAALRYRGIQVGEITHMGLGENLNQVLAHAKLYRRAKHFARQGTQMWAVGPQIDFDGVKNLDTLISGRYLALSPGQGALHTEFIALQAPPRENFVEAMQGPGLALILDAPRRGSLNRGSPVYYRQIQVGVVTGYDLGELADRVYIYLQIEPRYRSLVRENSVFWNTSGVDVNFGLLRGLDVHTESVRALLDGGLAFATPEPPQMGLQVESGSHFPLYSEAKPEWLLWRPEIAIPADKEKGRQFDTSIQ